MQLRIRVVLFSMALLLSGWQLSAQCKAVAKKQCFPSLAPYIQNGQFNSAVLASGESAEVQLVFYAGQAYRLIVCSEAVLGDVTFKVLDSEHNELYNSKKEASNTWDFKMSSTQQLIVVVEVPVSTSPNKIIPQGCVSIITGNKK